MTKNGGIPCPSFRLPAYAAPACPDFCPYYHRRRAVACWQHESACRSHVARARPPPRPVAREPGRPVRRSIACSEIVRDRAQAAETGDDLEYLGRFGNRRVTDIDKVIRQDRECLADE